MEIWKILGIEPTKEEDAIKNAYRSMLPQYHPEEDPEGFQRLREAYNKALDSIKDEDVDDSDTGRWIKKVESVYLDFSKRIKEENWQELLLDDVCVALDTASEANEKLLVFLMEHYRISHEVLKMLADHFGWLEKRDELIQKFPSNFVDYIISNATYEDRIRYYMFEPEDGKDYDHFIAQYLQLLGYIETGEKEQTGPLIEEMLQMEIKHPDFVILQIRNAMLLGNLEEAKVLSEALIKEYPSDQNTQYCAAQACLANKDPVKAREYFEQILSEKEDSIGAIIGIGDCFSMEELQEEAAEQYEKAREASPYNNYVYGALFNTYTKLTKEYEQQLSKEPDNEELKWKLAVAYLKSAQPQKAEEMLGTMQVPKGKEEEYYKRLADASEGQSHYEDAIKYWEQALPFTEKRAEILVDIGLAWAELEDYDKAIEYYDKGFEEDPMYIRSYYRKAGVLIKLKKYQDALELCDQGLLVDPDIPNLLYYKAEAFYHIKEYRAAIEYCNRALDYVFYGEAHLIKVKIFWETGQYEEVIEIAEGLMKHDYYEQEMLIYYARALRKTERSDDAGKVLGDLLEKYDNNPDIYYELSILAGDKEEFEEALEYVNQAIEIDGNDENQFFLKANILVRINRFEEALGIYEKRIKDDLADDYDYCKIGEIYNKMQRFDDAVKSYQKAIEKNPNNEYAHSELADTYENLGDFEKAVEEMNLQLAIAQGEYYFLQRGFFYTRIKKPEEALKDYEEVLKINPDNGYAHNNMGCIYRDRGEIEKAIPCFEKAVRGSEKIKQWFYNLGKCYQRTNRYDDAIACYRKAIEAHPDEDDFYKELAEICYNKKDYKMVLNYLKIYGHRGGDTIYIKKNTASAYIGMEEYEKAVEVYQEMIRDNKKDIEGYRGLGTFYVDEKKDGRQALKYLKKAVKIDPKDKNILFNIGEAYELLGKKKKADPYFEKVLEIAYEEIEKDPLYACYYEDAADACYHLGRYEEAIRMINKAIELAPTVAGCMSFGCHEAYFDLGNVYMAMGDEDKAVKAYRQAYKIYPDKRYHETIKRIKMK